MDSGRFVRFEEFDILLTSTSPTTAFPFGAKMNDPLAMYLCDIQTIPVKKIQRLFVHFTARYWIDSILFAPILTTLD